MSELRLTIGLPGSGKTKYATQLLFHNNNWLRINWDEMRKARGMDLRKFDRKSEEEMQKFSFEWAEIAGRRGSDVIVDNTNLSENTRNKWKGVAERAGMDYTEVRMDTPLAECIDRDQNRPDSVGRAVIERMALFADLITFRREERLVLVDMDGTLADCGHRRKYISNGNHEWDKFEGEAILQDLPHWGIIHLVKMLSDQGYVVLVVSGRSIDRAGKHTVQWLRNYHLDFNYRHIFMRQGGDHRQDYIVKQEILDKLPKDQISYVLDDRNQVVEMWRRNGLTCLQVADGNF